MPRPICPAAADLPCHAGGRRTVGELQKLQRVAVRVAEFVGVHTA